MADGLLGAAAYLSDLGSSVKLSSATATTLFSIATTGYRAPEMLRREPFGLPVDIWSLGCLLYYMLAGKTHVVNLDNYDGTGHLNNYYFYLASDNCKDLLNKMLAKD
jgi:serine/threonine protein kinase